MKYCAKCGTNLEVVSQALTGIKEDFFTKTDFAFDQFVARYAEHVFKDAPSEANDRSVGSSWRILGKGVVTTLMDLFLFMVMWNVLPLRFIILLISSPFRLLTNRAHRHKQEIAPIEVEARPALESGAPERWLAGTVGSVSEHTTERLRDYAEIKPGEGKARE
jgi:hypothetical protein